MFYEEPYRLFCHTFFDMKVILQSIPCWETTGTLFGYSIEAELDGTSEGPELIRIQLASYLEHALDLS